jgi:hypothetical protein
MAEAKYRKPPEESDDEVTNGKMGFLEHLDELRTRLIRTEPNHVSKPEARLCRNRHRSGTEAARPIAW